ncbi:MAG: Uncharacterized protein Athens071426_154 [Parcubacteria group bacterium Athens0714_26]|nr:MAG: Uncharacterized protein Athens101426_261 [Parcubacteria group bacterium Athens1014_26]TSD03610.1 MAG: Uncharacterized protein Athens071426_154 [Parcubacteria group bacterium Athens0714_26]
MFGFLRRIVSGDSYLGVDIGTTSIKVAELTRNKGVPFLRAYGFLEGYGHLERLNNAIQTSALKMLDNETAELLKLVISRSGAMSRRAVASLPSFSVFTTLLEMPLMSGADTSNTMIFQAKQYIPMPISAVTVDWIKVGEKKDDEGNTIQQILLVSVPNEVISKYKNIFKAADLDLVALEIEGISAARILTADSGVNSLIVDIGSRSTSIFVAQNGFLKFVGQTDFAGGSLTQTVSAGLNIRVRRAEDLKKRAGLIGVGGEYELSTLMMPMLDVIISEANRVMSNFENGYKEKIERIILSGGGANLLGLEKYFSEQIGFNVEKADSFSRIGYPAEIEPLVKDLGPAFTVALGLGIKEF